MSPIGGVGINLAVQDAVAAANILAEPLRGGTLTDDHLARVQGRREWPTRVTQSIQLAIQNRVVRRVLAGAAPSKPPSRHPGALGRDRSAAGARPHRRGDADFGLTRLRAAAPAS